MPPTKTPQSKAIARSRAEVDAAMQQLRANPGSAADRARALDRLLASTGAALRLAAALDEPSFPSGLRGEILARSSKHPEGHIRDLFERYLPEDQRTKRLGTAVDAAQILALPGDVGRGKKFFFEAAGVQCRNCHKIQGKGTEVGPDLSEIGKKYDRAALLETILQPSKKIDPKYLTYLVETAEGQLHTGLLVKKTPDETVLKNAKNELTRIPTADIEQITPQQTSLMPELLLRDMTAEQVADLTAFLGSLK